MLGRPFMHHQSHMADIILEVDPDTGRLAYRDVTIIIGRQQGKTDFTLSGMVHRAQAFEADGPQTILYAAQTAGEARQKWEDRHVKTLLASPLRSLFTVRYKLTAEAILWHNGSTHAPISTTGKTAGTGRDAIDMVVVDEVWAQEASTETGIGPTMITRPQPQLWKAGMVPGPSRRVSHGSAWMKRLRQIGRAQVAAGVDRDSAYFEYGAPEGSDPGDPLTWLSALPAIGHTVPINAIATDYGRMDLADFCAEYLSWWPEEKTHRWLVISRTTWEGLRDLESRIEGPRAFAAEMAEDRSRGWIGVAGWRGDGNWHVEIVEPGGQIPAETVGVDWMERRLVDLNEKWRARCVVLDPRRQGGSLKVPLENRGVTVLTPNQQDIAGACGRFVDATGEMAGDGGEHVRPVRWIHHLDQPELAGALAGVRKYTLPGGLFTFVTRGAAAVISPIYTVVLAMHGMDVLGHIEDEATPEPHIFL